VPFNPTRPLSSSPILESPAASLEPLASSRCRFAFHVPLPARRGGGCLPARDPFVPFRGCRIPKPARRGESRTCLPAGRSRFCRFTVSPFLSHSGTPSLRLLYIPSRANPPQPESQPVKMGKPQTSRTASKLRETWCLFTSFSFFLCPLYRFLFLGRNSRPKRIFRPAFHRGGRPPRRVNSDRREKQASGKESNDRAVVSLSLSPRR
jgi:hypothetical protein